MRIRIGQAPPADGTGSPSVSPELYPAVATPHTTRVGGPDPVATAIAVARFVWAAFPVNTVTLAPVDLGAVALAAVNLIHFPLDGPVLLTPRGALDPRVARELERLAPKGENAPAQVFLVGPLGQRVAREVQQRGFRALQLGGEDPAETAAATARVRAAVTPHVAAVLLVSAEDFTAGLAAAAWAAHEGHPLLYVRRQQVPAATLAFLRERSSLHALLLGGPGLIGPSVERQVAEVLRGGVWRVPGEEASTIAVHFARFHAPVAEVLGWARNLPDDGHAFTFVNRRTWQDAVTGAAFSHLTKHTPMLVLPDAHSVPALVARYLRSVNPGPFRVQPAPPFMHGYVIGPPEHVSVETQLELERLLMRPEEEVHGATGAG